MGTKSIDKNKGERLLTAKYPMNTKEGVNTFLNNYHALKSGAYYQSDFDALIMLIDFDFALMYSGLTDRELYVIAKVFNEDLKQVDVAELIGVTKQTIQTNINRATEKLAKYYEESGDYNDVADSEETI